MGTFFSIFGALYSLFEGLFSVAVYNAAVAERNIISDIIGPTTFAIVLVIVVLFYFIVRSSFNGWKSWLVVMCVTAVIAWVVGFTILPYADTYNSQQGETESVEDGDSEDDADYYADKDSDEDAGEDSDTGEITTLDCVGFGFTNMLISILEFLILSIILKRFSKSCRHTPWRSLGYVYKGR